MADETPTQPVSKKKDLVSEIGTLTYPRAVQTFGKENALAVMHKVAEIGGHGMFEDVHFMSPIFGGLSMPSPETVRPPQKFEYAHLPESDFWFQAALEEYEENKKKAVDVRAAINDFYNEVKK